ncbi:hypothetical protein HRbin32_01938 [bacterium HR32]|nr:hypothetical protein HRbin32_01938 [bacterium HR32]
MHGRAKCVAVLVVAFVFARPAGASPPHNLSVDLLVYGATPQGVAAASAAASRGVRVLLAEPGGAVGGAFTHSWLNTLDLSRDRSGAVLQGGLTTQFVRRLGSEDGVDVRRAERVLTGFLHEAGVAPRLLWRLEEVETSHDRVLSASFATPDGPVRVRAAAYLDATDTAELAAAAGARFTVGREDTGLDRRFMAAGLVFRLRGLDWRAVTAAACPRRPCEDGGWRGRLAWGFNRFLVRYVPADPNRFTLRGLELAFQDDGSVLVKGLQVFGVDPTDSDSLERAHRQAAAEALRALSFLRMAAPHLFGAADLVGVAPALYVRESRHLLGRYRLRADDVLYGRDFPDTVSLGGYPLDGQSYLPGEPPYLPGVPAPYGVPFRALLPERFDNLLVASPAASFDAVAAFSARVVPLQMSLGEACGIAVAVSRSLGRPPSVFAEDPNALGRLRNALRLAGLRLWTLRAPALDDVLDPGYPDAVELLRRGLFNGSYWVREGLHLRRPASLREWLENLEHFFRAQNAQAAVQTILAVRYASFPTLGYPLSTASAVALLRALGYSPAVPPDRPVLSRGEAASLLWSAWRGAFEPRREGALGCRGFWTLSACAQPPGRR